MLPRGLRAAAHARTARSVLPFGIARVDVPSAHKQGVLKLDSKDLASASCRSKASKDSHAHSMSVSRDSGSLSKYAVAYSLERDDQA